MNNVFIKQNFDVPVEMLYNAWTQPEHLKNWWGPNGFTNTFHEFDLQPGGCWKFTMHGADGKNYILVQQAKTSLPWNGVWCLLKKKYITL